MFPKLSCVAAAVLINLCGTCLSQTINITGTVVDSATSQGIGGATVKLLELPAVSATTSASGAFALAGTTAVQQPMSGNTPGCISLHGNKLTFNTSMSSVPVSVDAYACSGARVFHAVRTLDAAGELDLQGMWRTAGLYTVTVQLAGRKYTFTSVGIDANRVQLVSEQSITRESGLAKSNATYTLQVTANGYITKAVALGSTTTDVGTIRLVKDQVQTGVWKNVTPSGLSSGDVTGFGPGSIVGDPARKSDIYFGGSSSGLWKSTDYGVSWAKINGSLPDMARGTVIAVAGTSPATVWTVGHLSINKSTDAGQTFTSYPVSVDLYSLTVDPYDNNHLISGGHEIAGVWESTDGGVTWRSAGSGSIGGGISVYPFFIDMGNAAATRTTWIAIGQNGSSPGRTTNSGATWTMPAGLDNIQHPHGNAGIFQRGANVWVGGAWDFRGALYRSTDYGANFTRVTTDDRPQAVVWGTDKNVYSMYAWACSQCVMDPNFEIAPLPNGTTWTYKANPGPQIGPNSIVVTNDGTHNLFVGLMWADGIWRYVEP